MGNHTYQATTWQIKFEIENATPRTGDYTLQVALASASASELQVPTLPLIFKYDPSVIHD
jgi:rhamnogalacturonan endolyase